MRGHLRHRGDAWELRAFVGADRSLSALGFYREPERSGLDNGRWTESKTRK